MMENTRFSVSISHAIDLQSNQEGRREAIAFACATAGLASALALSPEERARVESFNSDEGLGDFAMPDVDIWTKKCRGGTDILCDMVRPAVVRLAPVQTGAVAQAANWPLL